MADPRNDIDFGGIGYQAQTFKIDDNTITYESDQKFGSSVVGLAVTLSAAGTVALAGDGAAILGRLVKVEVDGKAVVQTGGYCELPAGTGAVLTLGKKIVGDLLGTDPGYIREVATATAAELGVADHKIIDASTTTAVVVKLS
jgi:hypothetical protein